MNLKEAITTRKSVKHFSYKKVDWKKIVRAIDYARFAPTAGNKFVNKFILVSDEKKIKELATASQQEFVGEAKYIVIVTSDEKKLIQSYDDRGKRYAPQQAGAAIQNFLLGLTEQKLSTMWVGHFYPEQIHRIFKIPEKMKIEAIFPIGKARNIRTKPKLKEKLENYLYFEKYGKSKMN
ncbi:nitroreductase family protein [Candidatus Pacearchaeota archaeon]|nr:nitroreductase family protein [Candidatus Pacearchaeota archaeon]